MGRNILTIDPGSSAFGWAHWTNAEVVPSATGVVYARERGWLQNLEVVRLNLTQLSEQLCPNLAIIEQPFYAQGGSAQATASSGSLVKLCVSVGLMIAVLRERKVTVRLIDARHWKGQLDDAQVRQRIKKRLGQDVPYKSHAWDAVGIGLHYLTGKF